MCIPPRRSRERIIVPELLRIANTEVMVHLNLRLLLQEPKPQHRNQYHDPPGHAPRPVGLKVDENHVSAMAVMLYVQK